MYIIISFLVRIKKIIIGHIIRDFLFSESISNLNCILLNDRKYSRLSTYATNTYHRVDADGGATLYRGRQLLKQHD